MDQAVWAVFGIIAVLVGIVILLSVLGENKEESKYVLFKQSLDLLKNQCDFVCNSPADTYLSVSVELPSGLRLYSNQNRICAHLNISEKYSDETKCVLCACPISIRDDELNLQTQSALKAFSSHKYSCYFKRKENETEIECKG